MKHKGRFIVFLGPDGSGKSTIRKRLKCHLEELGYTVKYFHWCPLILEKIHAYKNEDKKENLNSIHSKKINSGNKIISNLRFLYYYMNFIVGGFFRITLPKISGDIVICERWYFDTILRPNRYEICTNIALIKYLGRYLVKPDHVVFLYGEPHEIHKRKKELNEEEINSYNFDIVENYGLNSNFKKLDTSLGVEACVKKIYEDTIRS